jgi:hypothetical protein
VASFFSALCAELVGEYVDITRIMLRGGKFFVVIFLVIFCLHNELFDYKYAIKVLRIITMLAVFYQLLQVVSHELMGMVLPRGIYSLLTYDVYGYENFNQINMTFYRASSFFIEPAVFVQYILLYLSISIFGNKNMTIEHLIEAMLISVSIVLSGSGQGLILLVAIWGFWYLFKIVLGKKRSVISLVLLVAVPIVIITVLPTFLSLNVVQNNLERIAGDNNLMGYATQARMVGYKYISDLKGVFYLIGRGYGNVVTDVYFPSVAYTFYSSGIIGISLVAIVFMWLIKNCRSYGKVFSLIYIVLIIGTTSFFGCNICFYFSFLIADALYNYNDIINEELAGGGA